MSSREVNKCHGTWPSGTELRGPWSTFPNPSPNPTVSPHLNVRSLKYIGRFGVCVWWSQWQAAVRRFLDLGDLGLLWFFPEIQLLEDFLMLGKHRNRLCWTGWGWGVLECFSTQKKSARNDFLEAPSIDDGSLLPLRKIIIYYAQRTILTIYSLYGLPMLDSRYLEGPPKLVFRVAAQHHTTTWHDHALIQFVATMSK